MKRTGKGAVSMIFLGELRLRSQFFIYLALRKNNMDSPLLLIPNWFCAAERTIPVVYSFVVALVYVLWAIIDRFC